MLVAFAEFERQTIAERVRADVVSETARAVAGAFAGALRRYGVPDEVLTDNGSAFTGRRRVRPGEVPGACL